MVVEVPKRAVWIAGAALLLLAIIGTYKGWQQSSPDAELGASADPLGPTVNAVSARQASALAEPPPPLLTEAQIRTIARQEARAALGQGESSPSSSSSESPAPSPPSRPAPPPVVRPTPTPLPTVPQPPPPAAPPEGGDQPPLF